MLGSQASGQTQLQGFETLETPHFSIYYHARDALVAEKLGIIAESARGRLLGRLPVTEDFRSVVILAGSEKEFRRDFATNLPEWSAAFAAPRSNVIVVRSPKDVGSAAEFGKTFTHEYAHLVIHNVVDHELLPRWFNEGMASYLAGQWGLGRSAALLWAAARSKLLRLDRIAYRFPAKTGRARLAYAQSYVAVEFLVQNYGWNGVERLLRRTAEIGSFDLAFTETLGVRVIEFEYAYLYFLKKRYRSFRLIVETFPFWSLVTILFLIAYIVKRLRARRRLASLGDICFPRW
jgi:hypothetical protein